MGPCGGPVGHFAQIGAESSDRSDVSDWRQDVVDALARMRVSFGARTAARNLPDCLDPGELVRELVACTYAGGDGLLVLTDRRVLAVRDDYGRYRVQAVPLAEAYAVDYAPKVHDGLGVLTPSGRIAVRRMNREDSDRLVHALVTAHPHVVIGASRPRPPAAPTGRPAAPATPAASVAAPTPAAPSVPASTATAQPEAPASPPTVEVAAPVEAPAADPVVAAVDADTDVLLGVLADLHAKGLLTSDELAAKIAQLTASSAGPAAS